MVILIRSNNSAEYLDIQLDAKKYKVRFTLQSRWSC